MGLGQSLGFINMSIFGRVHKYKECEHWSKIKVWIMSKMKWIIPKNKKDHQNWHNTTYTCLNQNKPMKEDS